MTTIATNTDLQRRSLQELYALHRDLLLERAKTAHGSVEHRQIETSLLLVAQVIRARLSRRFHPPGP